MSLHTCLCFHVSLHEWMPAFLACCRAIASKFLNNGDKAASLPAALLVRKQRRMFLVMSQVFTIAREILYCSIDVGKEQRSQISFSF